MSHGILAVEQAQLCIHRREVCLQGPLVATITFMALRLKVNILWVVLTRAHIL